MPYCLVFQIVGYKKNLVSGESSGRMIRKSPPGAGKLRAADSVGYQAHVLARLFRNHMNEHLRQLGMSVGQFAILRALWEENGLSLKGIADRCPIDLTTVTRTLGRMERDGLVKRRRNKHDKRIVNFFLTARAKANRDAAIAGTIEVNEHAFRGFDDVEREVAMILMERLEANLRRKSSVRAKPNLRPHP